MSSIYIGCSCDRNFVEPTAAMLASVDANGQVPEATVLVAAFSLTDDDMDLIRAGAGGLGHNLQFIDITHEVRSRVDYRRFSEFYPVSVLGRLFIPYQIREKGARLLTLDSDMIVNASLRPLFELDMGGAYFAAIHDTPRQEDQDYFNSGLTVTDVDTYLHYDVGSRSVGWISAQPSQPGFPDQDALNAVVGHIWCRLDRSWNYFCYGERHYTLQDYESANVAHFAGPKPWVYPEHPGAPLYRKYLSAAYESLRRTETYSQAGSASLCFQTLLGRDQGPITEAEGEDLIDTLASSKECAWNALFPIMRGVAFPAGRFPGRPSRTHKFWAANELAGSSQTAQRIKAARSWRDLLLALVEDPEFMNRAGLQFTLSSAPVQ